MEPNHTAEFSSSRNVSRPPLRVNNVARRLHRSERRIRQLARAGELRGFKIDGKSWGFQPCDVDAYKELLEARDAGRW